MIMREPKGLRSLLNRASGPDVPAGSRVPADTPLSPNGGVPDLGGAVVYAVGRPKPLRTTALASLFGGRTNGPRSTNPYQDHPQGFVGGNSGPSTNTSIGTEGGHAWGPLPNDQGFPKGSRFPGWPDDWDMPYFSRPDDHVSGSLTNKVSTVWTCVDLISRLLATMPTKITKNSRPIDGKPWQNNPEPLVYASWVDFCKCVINSMLIRGDAFIVATARYADGYPARFVCLNPDLVYVEPGAGGINSYWLGGVGDVLIDAEDILHLKYQVWPGHHRGIGPLEAASANLDSAENMASYASLMSGRGGIPNAVLQSEGTLTKDQAQGLKRSWRDMIATNGAEPVILTKGLTYHALSLTAKDMALLDHRVFDEQRIASTFGVPLLLAGLPMPDGLTYSTAEGIWEFFWRSNLRAIAHNVGMALSMWALPNEQFLKFDSDELTRPSALIRAQAYEIGIRSGVITPEEARIAEGRSPLADESELSNDNMSTTEKTKEGAPG